ncbi:MAG: hypothetical protein NTX03_10035 [Bacteroidetes bacterium]|nr:hypothetical protein [Bacteroidota bacterium]
MNTLYKPFLSRAERPNGLFVLFLITLMMLVLTTISFGQSNPTAYALSGGSYTFTSWASSSTSSTYPSNMYLHTHYTVDPTLSTSASCNWTSIYSFSSKSRISGQCINGISFVNRVTNL